MSETTGTAGTDAVPDPQESSMLRGILAGFSEDGFSSSFSVREGAEILCLTCRRQTPAAEFRVRALRRTEGASDPADMLAVVALVCPKCQAQGTLVLSYGPESSVEESEVLLALDDDRDGTGMHPSQR